MNLDSLITVISLLVAVYAVVPRVRKLEFRLKFGFFGWLLITTALGLILYLQFYQTFRVLGLTPELNLARWRLTTNNFSFLVLVSCAISVFTYLSLQKLSRRRVFKFREFVSELARERRYAELFSLVERNLSSLDRIYHARFFLSKIRAYLDKESSQYPLIFTLTQRELPQSSLRGKLSEAKMRMFGAMRYAFPTYQKERDAAGEIVHELLSNRMVIRGMIEARPYYALTFYGKKFREFQDFFERYLDELMHDADSILYHEIRHNQNLSRGHAYALPDRNRLLVFLFRDCRVAEELAAYRPVGEAVILDLDRRYESSAVDSYNGPMRDFDVDAKWESKVYVGLKFFDIMVKSSLYQNINWHMWLYYFETFAERIVRNLDPDPKHVDLFDEWPTRYHYFLYEVVSSLCNWAAEIKHLPLEQTNVVLGSTQATHENANIPKSAMLALGNVFKEIFTSEAVDDRFRGYLTQIAFRGYFDLQNREDLRPYSEALLNALRNGGHSMSSAPPGYSASLLDSFLNIDLVPFDSDACAEVQKLLESDNRHGKA